MVDLADRAIQGSAAMASLVDFRTGLYLCWTSWPDTAFELCEAMLCAPGPVSSLPALSLEPVFRRSHGSLYEALGRGDVDAEAIRDLLVAHRPADWPLVFAVDESTWARCDAETSPERGFYYSASKHSAGQPIVAGWSYQWITALDWACDSWTAPMDTVRIPPGADAVQVTATQLRDLTGRVEQSGLDGQVPTFVFDAGYDPIALSHELTDVAANLVTRIRDDRVFYTDPAPVPPGTTGRPRRPGDRRRCAEPETWPNPDHASTTIDDRYGTVHVSAWGGLHPKLGCRGHWNDFEAPPIVAGTVVRVEVEHLPKPTSRTKKTLWLWVAGPGIDAEVCARAYLRRFDIEHTFRFAKNTLGWTTPRVRTSEQADLWTLLVIAAYTQLRLARSLVKDHRLPWERRLKPARLTPARVRRGFRRTLSTLGTPASPPKAQHAGPGRPKGTRTGPRTRHPAIKKGTELTTLARDRSYMHSHLIREWGNVLLSKIDHSSVQRWIRRLSDRLAPATVDKCRQLMSAVMKAAIRDRLIAVNPVEGVQLPKNRRKAGDQLTITMDQLTTQLLPAVPDRYRALVALAGGTGLRWGECVGLR